MNIRHECPMSDLSFKVVAPMFLHAPDGQIITIERWSLSGFSIEGMKDELPEGLRLSIPFQGVDVQFPIEIRYNKDHDLFEFHNLTVRQRETLAVFYKGVLSGRMVSTKDIITSLDTPVDLVPMEETEEEKASGMAKVKPRIVRIIWNVIIYALLSAFLVGVVGQQIWQRLSTIELDHARFVAPINRYKAADAAYVQKIFVRKGTAVKAGDRLIRMQDPGREALVDAVRTEINIAEQRLRQASEQHKLHIKRKPEFRAVYLQAFMRLWRPWSAAEPRSMYYPPPIEKTWQALRRFDQGRSLHPGGYQDMLNEFQRRVDEYNLNFRRWKRELRNRKSAADELNVIARSDGIVSAVLVVEGSFVGRSDPVVELEDNTPRVAVGWLDDQMVGSVYIGMPASIWYFYKGQSRSISGKIVNLQAGVDDIQPDKFGMVVTIKADNAGLLNTRKWFRHNAPAKITLKRNLLGRLTKDVGDGSP